MPDSPGGGPIPAPGPATPTPGGEGPPARPRWRRGCARAAIVLAALSLALFLARRPILEAVPRALTVEDPEETADAIVVLAGDGGERVEHAVALWKRGRSRTGLLVLSGGPIYWKTTWSSLMAAHAEALGVPRENLLEQATSTTTREDASDTVDLLVARGDVRSIVLVTSAWHSRRAKAHFERAAAGRELRVISCPCPAPVLENGWWHDAPSTRGIVTEVLKYLW
ncbi:YdcF family protein [bacterium]|nr:YdcF family protein [bacterium]